jgi:hypothetical protein
VVDKSDRAVTAIDLTAQVRSDHARRTIGLAFDLPTLIGLPGLLDPSLI